MDLFGIFKKKTKLSDYTRSIKITDEQALLKIWKIEELGGKNKELQEQIYQLQQQISLNSAEANLIVQKLYADLENLHPQIRTPDTHHIRYIKQGDHYYFVAQDPKEE